MGASFYLFPDRREPMSSFERLNDRLAALELPTFERLTMNSALPVCYRLHIWDQRPFTAGKVWQAVHDNDWDHGVHLISRDELAHGWDRAYTFGSPAAAPDGGP